jgi:hypothetical protein
MTLFPRRREVKHDESPAGDDHSHHSYDGATVSHAQQGLEPKSFPEKHPDPPQVIRMLNQPATLDYTASGLLRQREDRGQGLTSRPVRPTSSRT